MKIKFKATKKRKQHNSVVEFRDGDTHDVSDAIANQLLADYPNNFSKTFKPKKDKAIFGKQNK